MTAPHHVNRCMIVDLPAPELDGAWRRHLETHQFGGVCLFRRNIQGAAQLRALVRDIRDVLGQQALIGIDQEGGAVLRVLDVPQFPSPMAVGACGDERLSRQLGGVAARGLLQYGINWNYAPVLDVNSNPANPVIGERSFGSDPGMVAKLGVAWAQGLEDAGVMASVKHFPGHGDTSVDSHLALPVVDKSRADLEACEWLPFRAALRAGVGSVMTAHILYPTLDASAPATLSHAILTGLLRQEWGYDGVVVTDSTDMQAISARHPNGEGAMLALAAGADAILACTHGDMDAQVRQVQALARGLQQKQLREQRIDEALLRLDRAARRFPGAFRPYGEGERASDERIVNAAVARAITVVGRPALPPPDARVLLVVPEHADVGGPYEDHLSGDALVRAFQLAFPNLTAVEYSPQAPLAALPHVRAATPEFVLFASTSRWGFSSGELELARAAMLHPVPRLHVALWNPYLVGHVDAPALVTYGFRQNSIDALIAVLRGAPAEGRLPFSWRVVSPQAGG